MSVRSELGGQQPEEIRLQDLTLEIPEKKSKIEFDPEREISEEDWREIDTLWEESKIKFINSNEGSQQGSLHAYHFIILTGYIFLLDRNRINEYDFSDILSNDGLTSRLKRECDSGGQEQHILENIAVILGIRDKFDTTEIGKPLFEDDIDSWKDDSEQLELLLRVMSHNRVKCHPDVYEEIRRKFSDKNIKDLREGVIKYQSEMRENGVPYHIQRFVHAATNLYIIFAKEISVRESGIRINTPKESFKQETPPRPERKELS